MSWERWDWGPGAAARQASSLRSSGPSVLYADSDRGFWAPLQCHYYSSDSQAMVSTHPESCSQEVASTFCPSCFDVTSIDDGRCKTCLECPVCSAGLNTCANLAGQFHLRCTHCPWTSVAGGLCEESAEALDASVALLFGDAGRHGHGPEEVLRGAAAQAVQSRAAQASAFATLLSRLDLTMATEECAPAARAGGGRRVSASWQTSDVEAMISNKQSQHTWPPRCASTPGDPAADHDDALLPRRRVCLTRKERWGWLVSLHFRPFSSSSSSSLGGVTASISFSSVMSRRSVSDINRGKPGILVMPKMNPLEGDTSSTFKSKKVPPSPSPVCAYPSSQLIFQEPTHPPLPASPVGMVAQDEERSAVYTPHHRAEPPHS